MGVGPGPGQRPRRRADGQADRPGQPSQHSPQDASRDGTLHAHVLLALGHPEPSVGLAHDDRRDADANGVLVGQASHSARAARASASRAKVATIRPVLTDVPPGGR